MVKSFSINLLNWLKNKFYLKSEVDSKLNNKADSSHSHSSVTTSANGFMISSDKSKLDGIATGATKVTVDSAMSSSSTNPVQNKVVNTALSGKASTSVATTSANGLMSASDKSKLDGITASADAVSFSRSLTSGTKIGTLTINGSATDLYSTNNTTYSAATTSAAGLMSAADKVKLNGVATGATKVTVDSAMSSSSTNPVQNKVIQSQITSLNNSINGKANSNHTHNDTTSLTRIDNDWVGLPAWYMVKNGWCFIQWEDPLQYLYNSGNTPTQGSWTKLGNVPVPQTGRAVYQQMTTASSHVRIQVTTSGVLQGYVNGSNYWTNGSMIYPTTATGI